MSLTVRVRLLGLAGFGLLALSLMIGVVVSELRTLAVEHAQVIERTRATTDAVRSEALGERFSHIIGNAIIHHDLNKTRTELKRLATEAETQIARLEREAVKPEERAEVTEALGHVRAIEAAIETRLLPLLEEASPLQDAVRATSEDIDAHVDGMHAILEKFAQATQADAVSVEAQFAHTQSMTLVFIVVIGAVAAAILLAVSLYVARSILVALGATRELTRKIAAGDLRGEMTISGTDEFAQMQHSCSAMQANLREIVGHLQEDATRIASMSDEFVLATEQIALATDNQSQAASSMAACVEQLSVSITHMSDRAADVRASSSSSGAAAKEGGIVVDRLLQENHQTSSSVEAAATRVEELGRLSNEVNSVVEVIREVAEQTNLLALNAAIEAARAGAQGRGFAVVADEVRKLAERTGQSTHEITRTITQIQTLVADVAGDMKAAVNQVRGGEGLSQQARDSIGEIGVRAREVMSAVEEITDALNEQSTASTDIARQVEQVAAASEENSAAVRTTANGARSLKDVAGRLQTVSGRFRLA